MQTGENFLTKLIIINIKHQQKNHGTIWDHLETFGTIWDHLGQFGHDNNRKKGEKPHLVMIFEEWHSMQRLLPNTN